MKKKPAEAGTQTRPRKGSSAQFINIQQRPKTAENEGGNFVSYQFINIQQRPKTRWNKARRFFRYQFINIQQRPKTRTTKKK